MAAVFIDQVNAITQNSINFFIVFNNLRQNKVTQYQQSFQPGSVAFYFMVSQFISICIFFVLLECGALAEPVGNLFKIESKILALH